jgi:hypothetical protein
MSVGNTEGNVKKKKAKKDYYSIIDTKYVITSNESLRSSYTV